MSAILPLPIFTGIDKITDVELGTPGQLLLDTQGELLIRYLKYAGFTMPYRKAYDNWLNNIMPLQIKTFTYNIKSGVISVDHVSYKSPYNDGTTNKPIYPKQMRINEGTYEVTIMVRYKFTPIERTFVNGEWKSQLRPDKAEISKETVFGKIPLMLGTQYCHLSQKTDRELIALGECPCDPLGYFIINGSEKLILLQEKLRVNKIIISYDKKLDTAVASYTVNTYRGPKKIYVLGSKFDELQLHIVGLQSNNPMNLFIAFRFLGINDAETVIEMIKYFIPQKYHRKVDPLLLLTVSESYKISDIYEYTAELIGDAKNAPREDKVTKINNIFNDNFYPNMNVSNTVGENNFIKAIMLIQQTAHFIQYKLGIVKMDDRDNYANKRIESAGRSMEQLFTSLLVAYATKIQSDLDKAGIGKEGLNIVSSFDKNYISNNFEKAFGTDSWGAPGTTQKENITDLLKRESVNSTLAQLTRINTPTNGYSSSIEPRLVHPSQCGYICLTGDTEVLLADGINTKKISDMNNDDRVLTINPETLQEEASAIKAYFKIIPKRVLKINTLSDREVKCSPDHPFLVARENKFQWIHAGDLKVGDYLIMRNYQSQLEKKGKLLIIGSQNVMPQHIEELKKNNLLDVDIDEERMAILARLTGALWTDGHLSKRKTCNGWCAEFYLGEEEDAKEVTADIENLGFNVSPYKSKLSLHIAENGKETQYLTYRVYKGGAFGNLMKLLGIPSGKKGNQENPLIPEWIINASLNVKREFLSGFQGGDGGRISMVVNDNNYKVQCGHTQQTCSPEFTQSHFKFINQLADMFRELGIECETYQGKIGDKIINCFRINNTYQNLYKYSSIIEYRYANEKIRASALPIEYIRYRMKLINDKQNLYEKVISLSKQNMRQCDIAQKLSIGARLVSRILNRGDDYKVSCIDRSAMKYTDFTNIVSTYHRRVFLPITSIEDIDIEPVYDFTTISENHSFYANGVVVKNCPVTSPEGERAGLIKSIAITCYPSIEQSDILLTTLMQEYRYNPINRDKDLNGENLLNPLGRIVNGSYVINHTPQKSYLAIVNGIPRGWINVDVGYQYVLSLRRTGVYPEITIIRSEQYKTLEIYTDGARPLRPLLIIDPADEEIVALKNGYLQKSTMAEIAKTGSYIEFLMRNGAIEYIDAYEQDANVYLAQTLNQLQKFKDDLKATESQLEIETLELQRLGITDLTETKDDLPDENGNFTEITLKKRSYAKLQDILRKLQGRPKFTHCELDPTAILGQTASAIPLASSNVAPRNMFTQGMINQSLGIYHSNQSERFDTSVKTLAYPTRPMFEAQANQAIGTHEMPNGQTVKVAFMSWTGFNQEDAIIFNRQSIDLGLFTTVKYFTYKSSINDHSSDYSEKYKRPNIITTNTEQKEKMLHRLRNIGENGMPLEGSFMEEGDVVISKVRIVDGKEIFIGETIGVGDEGIVHRVRISKNTKKNEVVRVMLRQIRKPEVGDKFASRSAQKGTMGLILPPESMPFIADGPDKGISPDIIINAHCLASRMTLGKMVEIVASKVGLIKGERQNATAFRPIDHKDIERNLREYGFNSKGNEMMYSGLTGKLFPAEIFIGPCYYSSLGKDVKDKIQARSSASVDPSSHEPTRGRTNASGKAIRFGTQENTALVGHSAPSILRERLNDSSDGFKIPHCLNCGVIATHNVELKTISCKNCKERGRFGQVTIPGSFKYLSQILMGLGINQTLGLSYRYEKNES
jgi:DNA-directed RNA polymerase beta subunit/intein/homing endonuclease